MKRFLFALLVLAVMAGAAGAVLPDRDIVILYTNDVHCGVDDHIGYAGLAFYRDEMKKRTPYVTLVDAGDVVQGGVIGTISNGRYLIEIMNAAGYDLAVPGNHEFDYGMAQFVNLEKNLKCGYVACNFRDLTTGRLVFEPYRMVDYGGAKVAFVGVCTPENITKSTPSSFMNENRDFIYDFDGDKTGEKLCASVQKAVDDARKAGADFVVAVGHLGEYEDVPDVWSAPHVVAHTRGIDAFIDGHSHEVTPCLLIKNLEGHEVPITQSGTKLQYIGQVTIDTAGKITTGLIDHVEGRDGKVADLIAELKSRYENTLSTKLGSTSFDLPAVDAQGEWLHRNAETELADFAADVILAAAEGKAEIAFINAGGIRATLNTGDLTYKDALSVFPFGNTLCICDVSGQTILDELEMGARLLPMRSGGLLHAAGLTYTVDTTIPSPVHLDDKNRLVGVSGPRRVRDVTVNGKPLDPSRAYSVASLSYVLLIGGDGHRFEGAQVTKPDFITMADAMAHYIKSLGTIPETYKNPQGRLKVIAAH